MSTSTIANTRTNASSGFFTISLAYLLSGCVSSTVASDPQLNEFDRITGAARAIESKFAGGQRTALADVPTTGSTDYAGFMSVKLASRTERVAAKIAGELFLTIDFAQGDRSMLAGHGNNFVNEYGTSLPGQLVLSGGTLNRGPNPTNSPTFNFDGYGSLTDTEQNTVMTISATFAGDFFGTDADALGGEVAGNAVTADKAQPFQGVFAVAESHGDRQ
ncbi:MULTISPECIES: hypothetical protein [unclassified Yoonia]|uniref:hypothetical protein n=1 Tax=unclassified Yoonia TaxID=2629118 RepID=UPI002AFE111E|nr:MULTISPECIES: hypothetical protein [unclassified Yoonia]